METNFDSRVLKDTHLTMETSHKQSDFFQQIFTIAHNTFREAVRDRVLYNLVLFVLIITVAAIFLGDLTDGREARTIVNLGLSAMLLFGIFISIFVGVSLVSKEIEKRTVFAIFAKPVERSTFIIGKYTGLCLTLFVNVLIMGVGISLALLWVGARDLAVSIWGAIFLIFLQLMIINGVATLLSSFSSPSLSALISFFIFIIGHFSVSLRDLTTGAGKIFFSFIYYILPNLSHFSFITNAAHGQFPNTAIIVGSTLYALVYISILLVLTILIFNRRNFK